MLTWDASAGQLKNGAITRIFLQKVALVFTELWTSRGKFLSDEEIATRTLLTKQEVHEAVRELRGSLSYFELFIVSPHHQSRSYRLIEDQFRAGVSALSSSATSAPPLSSSPMATGAAPEQKSN